MHIRGGLVLARLDCHPRLPVDARIRHVQTCSSCQNTRLARLVRVMLSCIPGAAADDDRVYSFHRRHFRCLPTDALDVLYASTRIGRPRFARGRTPSETPASLTRRQITCAANCLTACRLSTKSRDHGRSRCHSITLNKTTKRVRGCRLYHSAATDEGG